MTTQTTDASAAPRPPEPGARAGRAIKLADAGGLETLSMRKLGHELGVEAMAIYYHFANKERILDGIVDLVFGEIELPPRATPTGRRRCAGGRSPVRDALLRHRCGIGRMETRLNRVRRSCATTTR